MPVFVDTNVLVYAGDAGQPEKQARAREWLTLLWQRRAGRVSWQVLNEFYVVVTRKLSRHMPSALAREHVRHLAAWNPVPNDRLLVETAWRVQDACHLSWWDALVVAGASLSGCDMLLSEDFTAGASVVGILVVDPFTTAPSVLG